MTKKKRNHPSVDEILARPWCYYCERDFDDLKILINHQKAKHFKCERCGRRLNTAGGLSVHMSQVHKENLTAVDNALPNRAGLEIEIFGMEGIPDDVTLQHNQRVLTQFHQTEAERRAAGGNPGAGGQGGNPAKKAKTEDLSDIKKRLAEHKAAKLAAENGGSSGSATPTTTPGQSQTSAQQQPAFSPDSSTFSPFQQSYAPPPSATTFGAPQPYNAVPPHPPFPIPSYGQPPAPGYGPLPPQVPFPPVPYGQPPQPSFQQPPAFPPAFSPPPFGNQSPYPGQPFSPHIPPNGASPFAGPPAGLPAGPPRHYGAGSSVTQFPPQQRTQSPAHNSLPQRTGSGSLPPAPSLPQRPAVGAPPVNAFQFQQMHQGQIPSHQSHPIPQSQHNSPPGLNNGIHATLPNQPVDAPNAASIDDLISNASRRADTGTNEATTAVNAAQIATPQSTTLAQTTTTVPAKEDAAEEKNTKKEKEKEKAKQTRLVYSDNDISPEEKMVILPKYAFTPSKQSIRV